MIEESKSEQLMWMSSFHCYLFCLASVSSFWEVFHTQEKCTLSAYLWFRIVKVMFTSVRARHIQVKGPYLAECAGWSKRGENNWIFLVSFVPVFWVFSMVKYFGSWYRETCSNLSQLSFVLFGTIVYSSILFDGMRWFDTYVSRRSSCNLA